MNETAVVILNYNGQGFLKQFLPKLIEFTPEAKIIIADNASTDNSVDYVRKDHPEIQILQLEKNLGYSGGYNLALKKVNAQNLILLNSDIEVTPNWLPPLIKTLESSPRIAACQPKILDFNNRDRFDYAGAAGGFIDYLAYPFCRGRLFESIEKDQGQYNDSVPIFWASGACLAIKSDIFHRLGGFDEDFFAHMEEIDLCWRINRADHDIVYVPESKVYHVGGGTLQKSNPFKTYLNFRNGLSMLFKNSNGPTLLWKLPLRLFLDGIAALKFLIFESPKHFLAILKAHFHFYSRFGKLYKQRKTLKSLVQKSNSDIPMIYKRLVIVNYFLRGKKKYSELSD